MEGVKLSNSEIETPLLPQILFFWHATRIPFLICICALFLVRSLVEIRRRRLHKLDSSVPNSPKVLSIKKGVEVPAQSEDLKSLTPYSKSVLHPSQGSPTQQSASPKRVIGSKPLKKTAKDIYHLDVAKSFNIQPLIFFSSLTGSTEKHASAFANNLEVSLKSNNRILDPQVHDLSYIDFDDFFITPPKLTPDELGPTKYFYLLLIPSYNIDTILNTFLDHLQETHHDFRVDTAPLADLVGYSVFGFGDKEGWPGEQDGFCSQAIEVDKWLAKLTGRKRAFPLGLGNVKDDASERLGEWGIGIEEGLKDIIQKGGLGEGVQGSGDPVESDQGFEDDEAEDGNTTTTNSKRPQRGQGSLQDLEDLRPDLEVDSAVVPLAIDFTTYGKTSTTVSTPKEMVPKTSPTYTALTKQGYTIVGSHSGVKICRWTKSALRGRGSCYKYSFYGIKSHLCMETTPSLSCSNKCVFCWRHGTNPVGTSWRWQVDPPEKIFSGVKEGHYKKIKMMKGVPGVRAERFAEAMRIRHCALSLVGEPIFYPHINEFTALLHQEHISSFLVCNAQHPDQLASLKPVTQLYVSIDASNRDSLRKIDRPLHRDFWERFQKCLSILRQKRFSQRTVFRLTLVKGFNIEDEASGYADLIEKGLPCFIEVKGVTYCGTSTSASAGLTMQNVPFYEEVTTFVTALTSELQKRNLGYGIAAEHAHSCCILVASERFRIEGKWHTIIDYEKFFELLERGREFRPEDYIGPATPEWATWGNGGFNPEDERVYRKGKNKPTQVCLYLSKVDGLREESKGEAKGIRAGE
ncbi:MAG: hypothetical protein M1834_004183 [Cirrosporium novae-zelandiae]|nr:MAG: hypothetical protein M1834_004183 [Cirrosporium novae-zelandiae]